MKRVEIGKAITDEELGRRLAYELQVPDTYGKRLVKVYKKVIVDALKHGEGMNLDVVSIKLDTYKSRTYTKGFMRGKLRGMMYRYIVTPTKKGKEYLSKLTVENY